MLCVCGVKGHAVEVHSLLPNEFKLDSGGQVWWVPLPAEPSHQPYLGTFFFLIQKRWTRWMTFSGPANDVAQDTVNVVYLFSSLD